MKNLALLVLLLFFVQLPSISQSAEKLQNMYVEFCSWYEYEDVYVDSDGDVRFTFNDNEYYIGINEETPFFANLNVIYTFTIDLSDTEARIKALEACNYTSSNTAVVKAYLIGDQIQIGYETFVAEPEDFNAVIPIAIKQIEGSLEMLTGRLTE